MILVFEQDTRKHDGRRFLWRPSWFRGDWNGGRNWRLAWGLWSVSYFPDRGLRPFLDYVASGNQTWKSSREDSKK